MSKCAKIITNEIELDGICHGYLHLLTTFGLVSGHDLDL